MTGRLIVHTRRGVVEILLTGDAKTDALLEKWAARGVRRGGAVIGERGELAVDSDRPAQPEREAA